MNNQNKKKIKKSNIFINNLMTGYLKMKENKKLQILLLFLFYFDRIYELSNLCAKYNRDNQKS